MIFRSSHRRTTTTTRAIDSFVGDAPQRCDYALWDGSFLRPAIACGARSPGGVRYNRLVRMKGRIGGNIP